MPRKIFNSPKLEPRKSNIAELDEWIKEEARKLNKIYDEKNPQNSGTNKVTNLIIKKKIKYYNTF